MSQSALILWYVLLATAKTPKPNGYRALVAENVALRHQLSILKQAPKLSPIDRIVLGWCTLLTTPRPFRKLAIIVKPTTLLRYHKALIDRKYSALFSAKSKPKPGPKGPSQELIDAIVEMKRRNPRFGTPRIAQQINLIFGTNLNKDIVRRILEKHYHLPSSNDGTSWLAFLGHTKDSLWSLDLFRCESANLNSYWVLLVMDQFTRRIIGTAVHCGDLEGTTLCRKFYSISAKQPLPTYISSDNDPLFRYHRWKANLRILDVEEVKSIPYARISHPFFERLIGTIRRELLDQCLFWNTADLERKLAKFQEYYNHHRTHSALGGKRPPFN